MNKTRKEELDIPTDINGTPVVRIGERAIFDGKTWVTLVPEEEHDDRIWEFCLETGKLMQTQ